MKHVLSFAALAVVAGLLAATVAGIAAVQEPDMEAGRRFLTTGTVAANQSAWLEQHPLLFGGIVALGVFIAGLLVIITANTSRRP